MEWLFVFAPFGVVLLGWAVSGLLGLLEHTSQEEIDARKHIWRHIGGHGDKP